MVGDKQLSVFVKTMRTVGASQVVPVLKHPPANAGELINPWVGKILEREMATHPSVPAWRTPWTEGPGGYCVWSLRRVRHESSHACACTHTHTHENCKPQSQRDCMSNDKNHHLGGGEKPRRHTDCDKAV